MILYLSELLLVCLYLNSLCPDRQFAQAKLQKIVSLGFNFYHMTRQLIIERTIKAINQLPEDKAEEISDFADFIIKRYEEYCLTNGIQQLADKSKSFDFLKEEEELYSEADLKELYHA